MMSVKSGRPIVIWIVTITAFMFGLLTIKSGGSVLFIDGVDRQAAGNYVPFVLGFNFLAGFLYLAAGAGLWLGKHWAVSLSVFIAAATLIVFALFGLHVLNDGLYEARTVFAMSLRSVIWITIAIVAYQRKFTGTV